MRVSFAVPAMADRRGQAALCALRHNQKNIPGLVASRFLV